jgi:hypothetical protein
VRYQDFLPGQTPLGLAIPRRALTNSTSNAQVNATPAPNPPPPLVEDPTCPVPSSTIKTTDKSEFGLYKRFSSLEERPLDPDASLQPQDFCDFAPSVEEASKPDNLYPFPNRNTFLLGEWRASEGDGKSRDGFARLLEIISSETWDPKDVRGLNWTKINNLLAELTVIDDGEQGWADESAWRMSTVSINVPFNTKCAHPGPHAYEVQFRHRPIVPMLRDKILNQQPSDQFHHVPFEMRWHPGDRKEDVRVYGELYSSPAFLEAFDTLQVSFLIVPLCQFPICFVGFTA